MDEASVTLQNPGANKWQDRLGNYLYRIYKSFKTYEETTDNLEDLKEMSLFDI